MRLLSFGDTVSTAEYENIEGEIVLPKGDDEAITLLCPFTILIESPADLEMIEKVVANAHREMLSEPETFARVAAVGHASDLPATGEGENPEQILLRMIEDGKEWSLAPLHGAIVALGDAWREPQVKGDHINALLIFDPPPVPQSDHHVVETSGPLPMWILEQGSLLGTLQVIHGMYRVGRWALIAYGVVRPRFSSSQQAAQWFVDQLRRRAASNNPPPLSLNRLDQLPPCTSDKTSECKRYIILLHGLFSTDLGTFDGFLEAWKRKRATMSALHGPHCADPVFASTGIVGWAHDTLAPVSYNADALARCIVDIFDRTEHQIAFVCHSRGGLLARATLQKLIWRDPKWARRVRFVVTFGTPHHGAQLALNPARFVGSYCLLVRGTGRFVALDMFFVYMRHRRRVDGIEDLAPNTSPVSNFLVDLEREESRQHAPNAPQFIAVGGDATALRPQDMIGRWLAGLVGSARTHILGAAAHDNVVPTSSSLPSWALGLPPPGCDHSDYFKPLQRTMLDDVVSRLVTGLGMEQEIVDCMPRTRANC